MATNLCFQSQRTFKQIKKARVIETACSMLHSIISKMLPSVALYTTLSVYKYNRVHPSMDLLRSTNPKPEE